VEVTLTSIDKAFEWFVLLLTVLVAIIFQFLTWIADPQNNLRSIAGFMFSLVMPLMLSIIGWLWQLVTLRRERKIFLRLLSWSILSIVFLYYIELFFSLVILGLFKEFSIIATIVVLTVASLGGLFPYKQILNTYRALTINNRFWERHVLAIWSPFFSGIFVAGLFILLPFLPF